MSTKIKRDKHSNAIIMDDITGLIAYKSEKNRINRIKYLENSINIIKEDIIELRKLINANT